MKIKILKYKDHAENAIRRYGHNSNVEFIIVDSVEEIVRNSDVVMSCITYTDDMLSDPKWFKPGCLLLPVHLRGFQNCDMEFDKIFGDDYNQISGFKYFNQYKYFAETSEVLRGEKKGRESHEERIIVYYMGLSIHDIYAASQLYNYFKDVEDVEELGPQTKTWL